MCRLYGFRSNTPRKVECELIHAQNALIAQSRRDEEGDSNPDGWGLGTYPKHVPHVERQVEPAYASEAFRWAAARVYDCNVMAHVRRATVGGARPENTHPFEHGRWMLAHNGTVGAFQAIRPRLLEAMTHEHRTAIRGSTDSEHVFYLLLSLRDRQPDAPPLAILRRGILQVIDWTAEADPQAEVSLNLLWTDGEVLLGSRLGRSLWFVERDAVHHCEVCGEPHVYEDPGPAYRAVVVASERITGTEEWKAVPDGSVFCVDRNAAMHVASL